MKKFSLIPWFLAAGLCIAAGQPVKKSNVPGVVNFSQVETTVACAGATTPESLAEIKKMGFHSVINLRMATEPGAKIDEEAAAAKAAGINFIHLPFDERTADSSVIDQFLKAVADPQNQPAFIHCASGNRAAMMWFIKRVMVDKWDVERASEEAEQLGMTKSSLKTLALNYIQSHRK
jgi:uncharacterized protein (TIGR01244 family)